MHGVRRRQVQERCWSYQLHQLSGRLELAFAEHSSDRLPMHCRLFWRRWRHMHGMYRRKVEKRGRIQQLRRLPDKLRLSCR